MAEVTLGFEKQLWDMADKMRGRMGVKDTEYLVRAAEELFV